MNKYTLKLTTYLEKQKIDCSDFKDLYSELRDQEIPLSLAGRLEQHFDDCDHCQNLAGEIEFVIGEAKNCFQVREMPNDVRARLHQRLNLELGLNLS